MPHFARTRPAPKTSGGYVSFRPFVREDFCRRCAYCLLTELLAAGDEAFELDHFRPRSRFPELTDDFYNIYYACHKCNQFKSNRYPPPELEARNIGFVDLCTEEFDAHFRVGPDGKWSGITESGSYTIDMLRLNRRHLVDLRTILKQRGFDVHQKGFVEDEIRRLLSR